MRPQLVCRVRRGVVLTFDLKEGEMFVGRDKGLTVTVPLKGVSRRHARIVSEGDVFFIEDLFSTNGTFLNGEPVRREQLWHLDVITLGKEAELVYVERRREVEVVKREGILSATLTHVDTEEVHEIAVGEITLGRVAACNIVSEESAVSKMHARIERTATDLLLEDLGSANGTFVNGTRLRTAVLSDDDTLSLAGVDTYRVGIRRGEVKTTSSGRLRLTPSPDRGERSFSQNWKTRFDWNAEEYKAYAKKIQLEREVTGGAGGAAPVVEERAEPEPPRLATPKAVRSPEPARPPEPSPVKESSPAKEPSPGTIASVRLLGPSIELLVSEPGPYLLGRAKDVPLRVDDKSVSRVHARVILSDDRVQALVQDMGSVNGTKLNQKPVRKLTPLADGDVITLGVLDLTVKIERR